MPTTTPGCAADLSSRRLVQQSSGPEALRRLDGDPLTVYAGFDATAASLHVGHLVGILTLRRLQEAGHRPIALIGGATSAIGDPGGRTEERDLLGREQVEANVAGIRAQLERLLPPGGSGAGSMLLDNSEWLYGIGAVEFLRDVGKNFSVAQMISKESVRSRLEMREQGISFTEFSYMLLQAYDFLHLYEEYGCRLQLGGSDQWGNITMGIELVRRRHGAEVWGITWPLLVKADGSKLGKTETGTVWLDPKRTRPYELYQYFVRTEDAAVGSYLRYFTWLDLDRIQELEKSVRERPESRAAQRALAFEVTALVHGTEEASRAERISEALFGGDVRALDEASLLEAFSGAPSSSLPAAELDAAGVGLVDCLVSAGLVPSKSAARTTVGQGAAYVNLRRESDLSRRLSSEDLLAGRYILLSRGRKDHHLIRVE
jgi:tyrosyl-tRNA synthetase